MEGKHRLRMLEKNEELRHKREEIRRNLGDCMMRSFRICAAH